MRRYDPIYHKAMIDNWRRFANLPDEIADDEIFQIIDNDDLNYSSSQTDAENQENVEYLREKLGLNV